MSKYNIKELVAGKMARFTHFQNNELWYKTDDGFEFPVPIYDIGEAKFMAEEKAILLMRYIRKHVEMLEKAETEILNNG